LLWILAEAVIYIETMTQFLPPNLLALFAPRDPLPYLPPVDKLPHERKSNPYSGISAFLAQFENPKDTPPPTRVETKDEKKERKRKERAEQVAYKLEQDLALWDPTNDTNIYGDPFKTLFVARINYDTSESKLRREFDVYGPVKRVNLVVNRVCGKPRGYAFVEFDHERDMHAAYKHADGKKIDGRRVLVDVERGRTVKGWRPRRLGGGLGNTRRGGPDVNTKYSGRDDFSSRDRNAPADRSEALRDGPVMRGGSAERERYRRPERSRSRDRRRRSRSRERDGTRRRRSRERGAGAGERDIVKKEPVDEMAAEAGAAAEDGTSVVRKRERHRSRSRERSNRSKSRDRKRGRRSRSRDKRGGSKSRGDRRRDREAGAADGNNVSVKQELEDGADYGVGADGVNPNFYPPQQPPPAGQYGAEHGAIDPSNY